MTFVTLPSNYRTPTIATDKSFFTRLLPMLWTGSCRPASRLGCCQNVPRGGSGGRQFMRIVYRALLGVIIALAVMSLVNCNSYSCGGFGSLPCTAVTTGGSAGFGGGGGGGSQPTAFVFAVDQGGTIDGYTLNTGAGTFAATSGYTAPTIGTNEGGVGMAVAQKQFLYAGIAASEELYGWTISSSGMLTAISGMPLSAPFLDRYNGGVGQDNIITDPTGTYLFISDALDSEVWAYVIGSGGGLTAVTGSPFIMPFEPMNLACDGLGKYLYVIDGNHSTHQGTEIAAYSIGSGGVLTAVQGSPFAFPMWQVQGEPTGNFLIGTTGSNAYFGVTDDLHLYVFTITQSGTNAGAITESGSFSTVYSPFSIAVSPNTGGNLVYSFSFNDDATAFNPTEGYTLSSSGTLTAISGSPFTNLGEGTWGQFDQSGQNLMDYGSYTPSGSTVVTQIVPLSVGSAGVLTQPISTLDIATPGFWVVTDVP